MSSKLEPTIWSRDTGYRIPCFDRCEQQHECPVKEVHFKPSQPIV